MSKVCFAPFTVSSLIEFDPLMPWPLIYTLRNGAVTLTFERVNQKSLNELLSEVSLAIELFWFTISPTDIWIDSGNIKTEMPEWMPNSVLPRSIRGHFCSVLITKTDGFHMVIILINSFRDQKKLANLISEYRTYNSSISRCYGRSLSQSSDSLVQVEAGYDG